MKKNLIWKKWMVLLWMVIAAFQSMPVYAANSTTIYHAHTGSSSEGGGCYGEAHTQSHTKKCNQHFTKVNWCTIVCGAGHTQTNTVDGGYDSWPIPSTCDVVTGSYTTTYYTVNCDREGQALANFWIEDPPTEWTKELFLIPGVEILDAAMQPEEKPFLWSGGVVEGNTLKVTENGTYTCQLQVTESSDAADKLVSVTISNIDNKGPRITKREYEGEQCLATTMLTVEAEDLQEDGSLGSGLSEQPYSYDGGVTWTAENTFEIKENGKHRIMVRDRLGNETSETIVVNNLDTVGPSILNIKKSPSGETDGSVEVTVEAKDFKNEGEEGIGLHEDAYSFDGGRTWQKSNEYSITKNGTYRIAVRDKFENLTMEELIIDTIREKAPADNSGAGSRNPLPPITETTEEEVTTEEAVGEGNLSEKTIGKEPKDRKTMLWKETITSRKAEENMTIEEKEEKIPIDKARKNYQVIPEDRWKEAPAITVKTEKRRVNEKIVRVITYVSEAMALASGTALLIYLYLFLVPVYGKKGEKYKLLGFSLLKKEKEFYVNLSDALLQRNESICYMLYINYFVARRYFLDVLLIQAGKERIRKEIEHQIMFEKTDKSYF